MIHIKKIIYVIRFQVLLDGHVQSAHVFKVHVYLFSALWSSDTGRSEFILQYLLKLRKESVQGVSNSIWKARQLHGIVDDIVVGEQQVLSYAVTRS